MLGLYLVPVHDFPLQIEKNSYYCISIEEIVDAAITKCSQISHLDKMLQKHMNIGFVYITETFSEFF